MPWLLAPHQAGLLFSGKMLLEWGVVVSDASELLFEDIKKLNAQQRTDVPACFIYAPISNLPMTTKTQAFFFKHCTILFSDHPKLYFFFLWLKTLTNVVVSVCVCARLYVSVDLCLKVCLHQTRLLLNCRTGVDSAIRSHFRAGEGGVREKDRG